MIRYTDGQGIPHYKNTVPGDYDPFNRQRRFRLVENNGRWYTVDPRVRTFTARGNYNYVIVNGEVYVAKVASNAVMGSRSWATSILPGESTSILLGRFALERATAIEVDFNGGTILLDIISQELMIDGLRHLLRNCSGSVIEWEREWAIRRAIFRAEHERDLEAWLRTLPEADRLRFIVGLVDHQFIVALHLSHKCLMERQSFEAMFELGLKSANAYSIKFWLDALVPRLGFRRSVRLLSRFSDVDREAVAKALYYLMRFPEAKTPSPALDDLLAKVDARKTDLDETHPNEQMTEMT